MQLVVQPTGQIRCLYGEAVDLAALGRLHVEPNDRGQWLADLRPVGGPTLGPFSLRSEALAAERQWLEENWLTPGEGTG
jgi:hypothetical protein